MLWIKSDRGKGRPRQHVTDVGVHQPPHEAMFIKNYSIFRKYCELSTTCCHISIAINGDKEISG